jgi:RNA polymerase sigma factor (sigma-70 family)
MAPEDVKPACPRDAETVRLLQAGDPAGLRRLVEHHAGRVLGLLRAEFRRVLAEPDLDDALAIAVQRAWRQVAAFDADRGTLRAWFHVIARSSALRILQRARRDVSLPLPEAVAAAAEVEEERDSSKEAVRGRFLADLASCLRALRPLQRAVVEADLAAGGTANSAELAEQLATSRNAVYVSRSTGRKALRQALVGLGYRFEAGEGLRSTRGPQTDARRLRPVLERDP